MYLFNFLYVFLQLKNFETEKTRKKINKTNKEIVKHMKELIMSNKIASQLIENTAKNIKSWEEAMEVVREKEKNY